MEPHKEGGGSRAIALDKGGSAANVVHHQWSEGNGEWKEHRAPVSRWGWHHCRVPSLANLGTTNESCAADLTCSFPTSSTWAQIGGLGRKETSTETRKPSLSSLCDVFKLESQPLDDWITSGRPPTSSLPPSAWRSSSCFFSIPSSSTGLPCIWSRRIGLSHTDIYSLQPLSRDAGSRTTSSCAFRAWIG